MLLYSFTIAASDSVALAAGLIIDYVVIVP